MTTVITRVFNDEKSARYAEERLQFRGLPTRALQVITADASGNEAALRARMKKAMVHDSAIEGYAAHVLAGKALLVVRATYKPLTAATITRQKLAKLETVDTGDLVDDYYVPDGPEHAKSVLKEHPRFLTMQPGRTGYHGGPVTKGLGMRLLSNKPRRKSVYAGGRHMSRAFWPTPLLSRKERRKSVYAGGRYMSRAFWPMPLVTRKTRRKSVIPGGGLTISRILSWPTIS